MMVFAGQLLSGVSLMSRDTRDPLDELILYVRYNL